MCWIRVLALVMILAETRCDSLEEFYVPSTIIFNDIYTFNAVTSTEEDGSTVTEDYSIDRKQERLVEFHLPTTTELPARLPPDYILLEERKKTTTTTTEEPEDTIKVVPVKKNYQRGLFDLLFPPRRVKTFKNVFDSIRRVLSHTFRR